MTFSVPAQLIAAQTTKALDVWNGYSVSHGNPLCEQARLAKKFYDAVKDTAEAAPISVTGRFLSGALAA